MDYKAFTKTFDFGDGRTLTLETGKLAKQAHGSVVLKMGNTMILATVVSNYEAKEGLDFLPLSVDYQEKFASVGRIPGSFLRREGRLSDYEILICRIVDRAIRPLFPSDYHSETQVNLSLISSDENILPDALVGLAASAALCLSDIPFQGPISEVRVGRIDGKFVINPYRDQLENSDIDLIVSGTSTELNMVEGEMENISEADMVEALKFAHDCIIKQCKFQLEFVDLAGGRKPTREYNHEVNDLELKEQVKKDLYQKIYDVAKVPSGKDERSAAFKKILEDYLAAQGEELEDQKKALIQRYFGKVKKEAVRNMMLDTRGRLDGRKLDEVRPIWSEVNYLPSAHGSSVFTRGETQSLTSVTLGGKLDQQLLDSPMLSGFSNFMLHYNFPAFSTGEVRPNRGPGRREIGHGNLAARSIKRMLPDQMDYTIRVVSDILESNGSSSMATVCAGSMALFDAGIQMKGAVSGIAMGMISDSATGRYAILSDILGDEDHLGDMDFKIVGTEKGIVACQMDIKVDGLSYEQLAEALEQSRRGRLHILAKMNETIDKPKSELKPHTPRIEKIIIEKDKIGAVIGSGGKVIQDIQAQTGTTISIEEVDNKGIVEILATNAEGMDKAKEIITGIITDPEIGTVYDGVVKGIQDFGAFVEFLPGKQGLLHISEISWTRLNSMDGVYKEGDEVKVKLLDIDTKTGKFKLSHKVLTEKPEGYVEPAPRPARDRNDRRPDRKDDRHRR
ncbi:MAG: polyribonucleotide nucleotidyltransferase [Flavobacteriales bacterium]|nr:polyribonucleotide nucleotidyltransferase [Flavobacteriales bacterium]